MKKKLKGLITLIAVTFFMAFLDGMFYLGFTESFYTIIGLFQLGAIVWALKIVYGDEFQDELIRVNDKN